MYARHRLDVSGRDLLFALAACVSARGGRADAVARGWAGPSGLACLSVRSSFDLLLEALDLPSGSEVVMSAVTHPDMVRIVRAHGLRPVAVDLDLETLAPPTDLLEDAVTDASRMVVVAHLFGSRADLGPAVAVARRHGLLLVEDCAQVLRGPLDCGDERADVSLFSFGPIKAATALGGALVRVRDPDLLARMRSIQARWPVQTRHAYAAKAAKFLVLLGLGRPLPFGLLARLCRVAGRNFDAILTDFVRSRRSDADLVAFARQRPSAPLLALVERRLRRFGHDRLRRRIARAEALRRELPEWLEHPGAAAAEHVHWVFPVLSESRADLAASLRDAGVDAAAGTTAIALVEEAESTPEAERLLAHVLFLPAYPELPARAFRRLVEVLRASGRDSHVPCLAPDAARPRRARR